MLRWKRIWGTGWSWFPVAFAFVAVAAYAQTPRVGPYVVLDVTIEDVADLEALVDGGYIVDHVREGHAEVYATLEERDRLAGDGYIFEEIERQPIDFTYDEAAKGLGVYHSHATLTTELQNYAASFPNISRLVSIGSSAQGRELWAMLITDNPDLEEDEPEFKYISTMHGDEILGVEMCLYFIDRLLNDYGTDSRVTDLVDETAIWIMPLMNPDGHAVVQRLNASGFDLNRSFPYFPDEFMGTIFEDEALSDLDRQIEVGHVMRWSAENSFVLSGNMHGGALVVNYPYDEDFLEGEVEPITTGLDAPSPDDLLFEELSRRYSGPNVPMWASPTFPDGITNGSDWFRIRGGMQDWLYRFLGSNDVTIELSNAKIPPQSQIPTFWSENEESMFAYLEGVHIGVRGLVLDAGTAQPLYAKITVAGNAQSVYTDPDVGDYHRLLLPGTYTITYSAPGFYDMVVEGVQVLAGPATRVDVSLELIPISASSWIAQLCTVILLSILGFFTLNRSRSIR